MQLYDIKSQDLTNVINHPLFIQGVELAVEENFFPDPKFFHGSDEDLKLFTGLDFKDRAKLVVDKYPLPYIVGVEKVDEDNSEDTEYLQRDLRDRNYLLTLAKNKYELAWWTYLFNCEVQAVFITYPLSRFMFAGKNHYLHTNWKHKVITNFNLDNYYGNHKTTYTRDINDTYVLDPISQLLNLGTSWAFDELANCKTNKCIAPNDILDWYLATYSYDGRDNVPFYRWFASLIRDS